MPYNESMATILYTIGHSTLSLELFLDLLKQHEIVTLADIRRFPGSRSFPQFNQAELRAAVEEKGIAYRWIELLGGRRPRNKLITPSPNTGLRNDSFRNYADYMLTDAFREGMRELQELMSHGRTAIMCSESVYWRCHRRLVSDDVVARGGVVEHIFSNGTLKPHRMTAEARFRKGVLTYPAPKALIE